MTSKKPCKVAVNHMDSTGRPFALIMKKGMVAPYPLKQHGRVRSSCCRRVKYTPATPRGNHQAAMMCLNNWWLTVTSQDTILIASTGFNGRELYAIEDRPNQLYMVGSMGCAASLGLGLSLVRPDQKVIVIDGDGAVLMRMGNMATVGAYGGDNFYHLVLDNHVHESTGGQATVSSAVDFQAVATGLRLPKCFSGYGGCAGISAGFYNAKAPAFMLIETCRGVPEGLPRPSVKPADVARRLMKHLDVNTAWLSLQ